MTKTLFVGDIHGDTKALIRLTKYAMKLGAIERVIQVGDFSINPADYQFAWPFDIPLWFIAGNHDHYHALARGIELAPNVRYIKRGEIVDGILFVGGAYSIDRDLRVPGVDWFPEEQMSYKEYIKIYHSIGNFRLNDLNIRAMICHDAPHFAYSEQFGITTLRGSQNTHTISLTEIFNQTKPSFYVHGHHHKRLTYKHDNCTFGSLDTTSHYKTGRLQAMYENCTVICDV